MATMLSIRNYYRYALQDLGNQLEKINDPAPTDDVRDKAIAEAINWYSRRVPRLSTLLLASIPAGFYQLPNDWQMWSRMILLEFPLNTMPPTYIPNKYFGIQATETVSNFFVNPNPTGNFRLSYTTVHGGGPDNVASVISDHEGIVGKFAASIAADWFADRYANSVSNNLDAVQYRTKEQEWRAVAKNLRDQADVELRPAEYSQMYSSDGEARYFKGWR
jgi:hypothetical protein